MKTIKNFLKAVVVLTGFSLVLKVIGFFIRIIISRELGAEAMGLYSVALSFYGVLSTIINSGMPVTISHYSSKATVNKDFVKENKAVTASLIIQFILNVGIFLFIILGENLIIKITNPTSTKLLLLLYPAIFANGINATFRGALWGRKKHLQNCISEFAESLLYLILLVALLSGPASGILASFTTASCKSISCFASMILSIYYFFKYGGRLVNPKGEFYNVFKSSMSITGVRLVSSLAQPIIAIILPMQLINGGYSPEQAMSLFGIALGMTFPLLAFPQTLIGSFATALIPELSASLEANNKTEFNNQSKSAISFTLFISFCFIPIFLGLGEQIGIILFNNAVSGYLLAISCWVMIPMGLNGITYSILNTLGLEMKGFRNQVISSIFLMGAIWFLPKYMGISAVIWGMGVSMLLSTILNCFSFYSKHDITGYVLKPTIVMSIISIPSALLGKWLFSILKYVLPAFVNTCFSAGIALGVFILLCIVFNIINLSSLFVQFKEYKKKKSIVNLNKKVVENSVKK